MKKSIRIFYSLALLVVISACANNNSYDKSAKERANIDIPFNRALFLDDEKTINIQGDMFTLSLSQQNIILSAINNII